MAVIDFKDGPPTAIFLGEPESFFADTERNSCERFRQNLFSSYGGVAIREKSKLTTCGHIF